MTYLPKNIMKSVLEFCDDRIERKRDRLWKSISIDRKIVLWESSSGKKNSGYITYEETYYYRVDTQEVKYGDYEEVKYNREYSNGRCYNTEIITGDY